MVSKMQSALNVVALHTALASQARTVAVLEAIEEDAIPSTTTAATTTTAIPAATRLMRRGRDPRESSSDIGAPRARKTRCASRRAPS